MAENSIEFLKTMRRGLLAHDPAEKRPEETAAVAVLFKRTPSRGGEFLLIRRAKRLGDPWSGQVAFPGGRVKSADRSFLETAKRETKEEVGIDLSTRAEFLGYMKPFEPRNRKILVVPVVFVMTTRSRVTHGSEVSSHRWIALNKLLSGKYVSTHTAEVAGSAVTLPSLGFGEYVVWGLTERILTNLVNQGAVETPA